MMGTSKASKAPSSGIDWLDELREAAAKQGAKVIVGPGLDALAQRGLGDAFAKRGVSIPPSYAAFLAQQRHLSVVDANGRATSFAVLDPKTLSTETAKFVRLPAGLMAEGADGKEVLASTAHLLVFAADGPEARWCFDCEEPLAGGELAIVWHHQDESETYRDARTRAKLFPKKKPAFRSFSAWLRDAVTRAGGAR